MNNSVFLHIARFISLVFLQVVLFNHINFLGYINPYIYIMFIALFPVKNNRFIIIFLSFFIGLTIDVFSDTGGIHAAACVFIAYVRPLILKFSFGMIYDHQTIKFNTVEFGEKLTYLTILTLLHHFMLFFLEMFSVSQIILVLQKTLFSSIFTILLILIVTIIFSKKTK
ncbi:rod shape-determining protein MreD [Mariniflexile fucanivorans]|uniref:Rod shape-determining protein MreD n=1 Tax=Mariniflexile fucanivorans TaxID=264023 RepID=A0A4R1RHA2_9FLAO|nr:rod shape-determining protein MreD [Mariniflexile fucanivorans]TCL65445.1 rod shape-determining protein MreD [Mariniflexile fucanivorans]